MNTMAAIIDLMFMAVIVGTVARMFKIVELTKMAGSIRKLKPCLSERKVNDSIKIFESVDTLMYMTINLAVIFGWVYVHFMM